MPRKLTKRRNNKSRGRKYHKKRGTRKQTPIVMVGCANCGPNCHCGPKCNCKHPCPGTCYLNRSKKDLKKGGSGCGSCGCPLAPMSWNRMNHFSGKQMGGKQMGGKQMSYPPILGIGQNGGSPVPGPFVGSSWSATNWPGMDGISGNRNYLSPYNTDSNPQLQMQLSDANAGYKNANSLIGGYTYSKRRNSGSLSKSKSTKGGGLIPQDLLNLGNDFTFNIKSAYNALNGYAAPTNPLPYKDQLPHSGKLVV